MRFEDLPIGSIFSYHMGMRELYVKIEPTIEMHSTEMINCVAVTVECDDHGNSHPDGDLLPDRAFVYDIIIPVVRVCEASSGFYVEHITTGLTRWMSDGVDVFECIGPGNQFFAEVWGASLNMNQFETMKAYFPQIGQAVQLKVSTEYFKEQLEFATKIGADEADPDFDNLVSLLANIDQAFSNGAASVVLVPAREK